MRRRRPRAARLHHQSPPAPDPLPAPTEPYFELIAVFPGPDMPTHVLRDLQPTELAALGADLVTAQAHDEDLANVLATWSAIR